MVSKTRKLKKPSKGSKGSNDWIIAIPSYKRTEILKEKTLSVLKHYGIEPQRIYIFVADESEEEAYKAALDPGSYNKIIVAEKGLHNARNVINQYFPIGKKIVSADDDIRGFIEFSETAKRKEVPLKSLKGLIERGFKEADAAGARLWGVYPSANGFFMKNTVTTDLRLIVGSFWGQRNPGKEVTLDFSEKEDYLRTLLFYSKDKKVVRLNFVSPQTAYYKTPGGMQLNRTKENQEKAVKELIKRYPDYVAVNPHRKSGFMEIRLRDKTRAKTKTTEHT